MICLLHGAQADKHIDTHTPKDQNRGKWSLQKFAQ